MAKGKVQHWKHGWIPLTAWARAYRDGHTTQRPTSDRTSPAGVIDHDAARRQRYAAHLNATADKRAAMEKRYAAASARNADKDAARRARYQAAQARKQPTLALGGASVVASVNRADDLSDSQVWAREMGKVGVPVKQGGREQIYSPEAEGTAARILSKYSALEPSVTPQLVKTASSHGGYMMGLAYKLKTQESLAGKLERKSAEKNVSVGDYGSRVADALRYTMIAPSDNYAEATQSAIDDFRRQGYRVDVENTWGPDTPYKGVNTNLTRDGLTFELQFHTEDSFNVKMAQHGLYETARKPETPEDEKKAAIAQMEANMAGLADPPGATSIH